MPKTDSTDEDEVAGISISFCLSSDNIDPALITIQLGVEPSKAWAKGDKYLGKKLNLETRRIEQCWREHPWGLWCLNSGTRVISNDIEAHVVSMLSVFESKKDILKCYVEDPECAVRFHIKWEAAEGRSGYELSSEFLVRLAALSNYIQFDYHCVASQRKDEQKHLPGLLD